jgi:3-phosphoglycerate kinase
VRVLENLDLTGKRVLLRADLNVPLEHPPGASRDRSPPGVRALE